MRRDSATVDRGSDGREDRVAVAGVVAVIVASLALVFAAVEGLHSITFAALVAPLATSLALAVLLMVDAGPLMRRRFASLVLTIAFTLMAFAAFLSGIRDIELVFLIAAAISATVTVFGGRLERLRAKG